MKKTNYILILLVQIASSSVFAGPSHVSVARCEVQMESRKCDLDWDFSTAPSARYVVERLNADNGKWQAVQRSDAMSLTGSTRVSGGYLYRTLGCDGGAPAQADACTSSNVVWAPLYLPEDEIPPFVADGSGKLVMTIEKNAGHMEQLEQYNVYMMVRLLRGKNVDLASLPPMREVTENDVWANGQWSHAKEMQRSFYINFSGMREIARNDAKLVSNGVETN